MHDMSGEELRAAFGPRLPRPDTPEEFIELRSRYEELTAMTISEALEVEVWVAQLAALFVDTRKAGYFVQEVSHD